MHQYLLPDYEKRTRNVDLLMFHCNAFSLETFASILMETKTSCHYYISARGEITLMVPEDLKAYHAGHGEWRGEADLNNRSIGIELEHPLLGQSTYPSLQIGALMELSRDIISRYNIAPYNIIGHSDSAPERKPDPGSHFPWQLLAEQGIGLWYNRRSRSKETSIPTLLGTIGYPTSSPELISASAYAFCRRFLPTLTQIDKDIQHLVNNPVPPHHILDSELFLRTLQAVALSFNPPQA